MTDASLGDAPGVERSRVIIFDTTLRDGEQSPGASMSVTEKVELAEILEALRVDVIEAGFPIASHAQYEAVRQISETVTESVVCALARPAREDVERCGEAIRPARRGRIHLFVSTSPLHMRWEQRMEPDQVLDAVTRSVRHARELTDDVEWTAPDATRADRDFLRRRSRRRTWGGLLDPLPR